MSQKIITNFVTRTNFDSVLTSFIQFVSFFDVLILSITSTDMTTGNALHYTSSLLEVGKMNKVIHLL